MAHDGGEGRRIHFSKWDGRAHWSCEDIVTLGVDEVGTWIGWYAGTHWERPAYGDKPGASFDAAGDQVMLLPHDRWFTMTFYERVGLGRGAGSGLQGLQQL